MILAIISASARAGLALMVVYLLIKLGHILNFRERLGSGIMGGCGFLTIPVILDVNKTGTPFDVIAGLAFSVGAILFFWGFIDRKTGHERRNRQAVIEAERHLAGKRP